MKKFIFIFLLFMAAEISAQSTYDLMYQQNYHELTGKGVIRCHDGTGFFATERYGNFTFLSTFDIVHLDANGQELFKKTYVPGQDVGYVGLFDYGQLADHNGFFVYGSYMDTLEFTRYNCIWFFDNAGNSTSTKIFPAEPNGLQGITTKPVALQLPSGNFLMTVPDSRATTVMMTDAACNPIWVHKRSHDAIFMAQAYPISLCINRNNKILVTHRSSMHCGFYLLDSTGALLWSKVFSNAPNIDITACCALSDGNFLIGPEGGLVKIDENGNVLYMKKYPTVYFISCMEEMPNGDFLISGKLTNNKSFIMRTLNSGNPFLAKEIGFNPSQILPFAYYTSDGGYVTSFSMYTTFGALCFCVLKLDSAMNTDCTLSDVAVPNSNYYLLTTASEVQYETPINIQMSTGVASFTTSQIYSISYCVMANVGNEEKAVELNIFPNPVSSQGTITLNAGNISGPLLLSVYDAKGTLVAQEKISAASGTASWQLSGLGSGLYLVRLRDEQGREYVTRIITE